MKKKNQTDFGEILRVGTSLFCKDKQQLFKPNQSKILDLASSLSAQWVYVGCLFGSSGVSQSLIGLRTYFVKGLLKRDSQGVLILTL